MASGTEIEPMMTVREVARLLNVHSNTVRRWSDRGVIRAYRITRRGDRRYRREDIARFLVEFSKNDGGQHTANLYKREGR